MCIISLSMTIKNRYNNGIGTFAKLQDASDDVILERRKEDED